MSVLTSAEIVDTFVEMQPQLERIVDARVACTSAAQDIVQDIYFRIQKIADDLPSRDDARRYLTRMAVNAAIDHVRVESHRVELLMGNLALFENYHKGPQDGALTSEQVTLVNDALLELPEKCRSVLYLSRIEGLTHAEIAEQLGISRSLVEKYIVKALLHCRQKIKT